MRLTTILICFALLAHHFNSFSRPLITFLISILSSFSLLSLSSPVPFIFRFSSFLFLCDEFHSVRVRWKPTLNVLWHCKGRSGIYLEPSSLSERKNLCEIESNCEPQKHSSLYRWISLLQSEEVVSKLWQDCGSLSWRISSPLASTWKVPPTKMLW